MLSFEEIINSIADAEMLKSYDGLTLDDYDKEHPELDSKILSEEEQKLNVSFWAKASISHVGWDSFGKENNDNFKRKIEQLYNNIKGNKKQKDFMSDVAKETSQYVQDRHFLLMTGKDNKSGGGQKEKANVGSNIANSKEKPEGFELIGEEKRLDNEKQEYILWQIGTIKSKGEDILVVSIPNLSDDNSYNGWQKFIEIFDKYYTENRDNLEKGRIILDVRGNGGGEDKPIDHIAKRLYGNMVNTYKRCEIKDSAISNKFLHDHGAYKEKNLERDGIKKENIIQRKYFSDKNQVLFDQTNVYYPFNDEKGYKGRIDILIDRNVGSSAESAYTSFYHHPNVRYVGENTAGMQQFTQGSFAMPCGYLMRVGVTKLTYWDKEGENIEVKGHKPDVECKGKDALKVALAINRDKGRVLGFRKLNEEVRGEKVYLDYNPKDKTDPRKAYYAKYLEPAIAEIEQKNRADALFNSISSRAKNIAGKNFEKNISKEDKLRGLGGVEVKVPYKQTQDISKVDFNSLKMTKDSTRK